MFSLLTKTTPSPDRQRAVRRGPVNWMCALLPLIFLAACPVYAAAVVDVAQYAAVPGGTLVIHGTSTLHDWSAQTKGLAGRAVLDGSWTGHGAGAIELKSIHLVIAVKSLKSSEGGGMDSTMYGALHRRKHAFITYQLTTAKLLAPPAGKDAPAVFKTKGNLKVDGTTRSVPLVLTVTHLANGDLSIATTVKLKMTEFGVKPPTAMFGIIRSGDAITVNATWLLAAKAGA